MQNKKYCPYNTNKKGIVRYLATLSEGLFYHIVTYSSSKSLATDYDTYPFTNSVDGSGVWHSKDMVNSWISIKFNYYYVSVDSYVLRSTYNYPISWDLQGLTKFNTWKSISTIRGDTSLNSSNFGTYNTYNKAFYKQLRLIMSGTRVRTDSYSDDHCFELKYIEFFGAISKHPYKTLNYRNYHHSDIVISMLYVVIVYEGRTYI